MSDIKIRADLSGISADSCPKACNVDRCQISGRAFCLHPRKATMPSSLAPNADVQSTWAEACQTIGVKNPWNAS